MSGIARSDSQRFHLVRALAVTAHEMPVPGADSLLRQFVQSAPTGAKSTLLSALRTLAWNAAMEGTFLQAMTLLARASSVAKIDGEPLAIVERLGVEVERADVLALCAGVEFAVTFDALCAIRAAARSVEWRAVPAEHRDVLPAAARTLAEFGLSRDALSLLEAAPAPAGAGARSAAFGDEAFAFACAAVRPADAAEAATHAYTAFRRLGYVWRAARIALLLFRISGNGIWEERARSHLQAYPRSPLRRRIRPSLERLSPRQQDVLALLLRGAASKAIAARLGISESTVNQHVAKLLRYFGVHSRAELYASILRASGYDLEQAP
ncbi:MAG: helix-turn-helix transcriptional regulator [Candidatus Tyrphobacter sp.]